MSNPRAGAFPSRMDDAFNLVGELFSAANATLSQATGQVLHKMTGGKLDGSEVWRHSDRPNMFACS